MYDRLTALSNRPYLVALLLGLAAQILFTVHLDQPSRIMFDEVHYVPAAHALLDAVGPRNVEHPLVGKELIGAGILLLGDNPFGWRLFGTIAASATVMGIFALVWLLTAGSMRAGVMGGLFAALNQSLFVQARTAMLDVYLGAFLIWAGVLMLWAMRASGRQAWRRWIGASVLLGLAVGTKWSAIPYVALAGLVFLATRWKLGAEKHWQGIGTVPGLLVLGSVSILTYFATFFPAFFYAEAPLTLRGLIPLQLDMYKLQTQILASHNYQSDWWSWPLMIRPIWYFYEVDAGAQRGVLLIGNPVIMWGGLLAVLACYWAWFKAKNRAALTAALLWTVSLGIYAVIPKSLGFYYYYHLSALFLCVALAVAFHHFDRGANKGREEWFAAAALVAFIYFYPILAASPLANDQAFRHWMWLPTWP